ncbi:hypothetical protein EJB05_45424 [Eragrostis curvula]|uniref:EF-hand domain-containing protein n=1 Tax=Eragrostis curvula TaxID=38414 RepID=A0A5J9TKB4_9POAL|nr:hypothetical protein EJB05_45424 [Eragrostis curvula]
MAAGWGLWTTASMAFVLLICIVCCGQVSVEAFPHFGRAGGGASLTDLQRHVEFFDRNKDGVITLTESITGFIAIGFEPTFATASATATHAAFGPLTTPPGKLPSTNIHISHIHRAIHGSDSGAYDKKGTFVPENFEKIFKKHAHIKPDCLTWLEIRELLIANRDLLDPISWAPAEVEWELIYQLGKDKRGYLHKETLRGVYDGTVFYQFANRTDVTLRSDV